MASYLEDKFAELEQLVKRLRSDRKLEFGAMMLPAMVVVTMLLPVGLLSWHLTSYVKEFCDANVAGCKIASKGESESTGTTMLAAADAAVAKALAAKAAADKAAIDAKQVLPAQQVGGVK